MDESEERPWEHPYCVRRDCEPYRGDFLKTLGTICLFSGGFSLCLFVPSLIAVPLGFVVWKMARQDLNRMNEGLIETDPDKYEQTCTARNYAIGGIVVSFLAWTTWLARWYIILTIPHR